MAEDFPLPRLDCDITTVSRTKNRARLTCLAGRDFVGAQSLVVGSNYDVDDPMTFREVTAADALMHLSGYVAIWGDQKFPCGVPPIFQAYYQRLFEIDRHPFFQIITAIRVPDAVFLYMPDRGLERRTRLFVPEERIPDAMHAFEQYIRSFTEHMELSALTDHGK